MAQAKATQDMVQLMLLRSMGMNTSAGLTMVPNAPVDAEIPGSANKQQSEEKED